MGIAQIIYVACGIASLSWGFSNHGKLVGSNFIHLTLAWWGGFFG
jgi:hypothetical protein